jgi:hypothetical protein
MYVRSFSPAFALAADFWAVVALGTHAPLLKACRDFMTKVEL